MFDETCIRAASKNRLLHDIDQSIRPNCWVPVDTYQLPCIICIWACTYGVGLGGKLAYYVDIYTWEIQRYFFREAAQEYARLSRRKTTTTIAHVCCDAMRCDATRILVEATYLPTGAPTYIHTYTYVGWLVVCRNERSTCVSIYQNLQMEAIEQ